MAFWTKKAGESASPAVTNSASHNAGDAAVPASHLEPLQSTHAMDAMTAPVNGSTSPMQHADSASAPQQPQLSDDQRRKLASASKMVAAAFGEIVSLLMRTPNYKHLMLSDLEWFVVPAVASGQFSLAEAQSKSSGITQPMGVVLWARVSPEVDQRLHEDLDQPIKLKPGDWTSGDSLWLIEAAGEARVIEALVKRMRETIWAGRTVKLRARGPDGKAAIGTLPAAEAAASRAAPAGA